MKIENVISWIEKTAPLHFQAEWDASGVQVASVATNVSHVGVMLDPTVESVKKALSAGADFLLAHHPLSMQPRRLNILDGYFTVVSLLMQRSVCLYSAHTSLDANPDGPVRWLADALGLQGVSTLEPVDDCHGFGFVGNLSQPVTYDGFCHMLGINGISPWRACGPQSSTVQRVACCPGSGSSLIARAQAEKADVFITGDMKYHPATEAALRVLDVGHFILEEKMMEIFARQLGRELALPVTFIAAADPFNFESAPV